MKTQWKKTMIAGLALLAGFVLWTALILLVDVQPVGQKGTNIGFAAFNTWFHRLTGVHMILYTVTDWLGLVLICFVLPAVLSLVIHFFVRKAGWVKDGDLKI